MTEKIRGSRTLLLLIGIQIAQSNGSGAWVNICERIENVSESGGRDIGGLWKKAANQLSTSSSDAQQRSIESPD